MLRGIEDSRGRMREIFPVAQPWVDDPRGSPPRAPGAGWGPNVLVPASLLLVLLAPLMPGSARVVAWGVGSLLAVVGVAAFVMNPRRAAGAYMAYSSLLSNGYCPACAYRIDTIRPDPDGCTVCPECGAAWRR